MLTTDRDDLLYKFLLLVYELNTDCPVVRQEVNVALPDEEKLVRGAEGSQQIDTMYPKKV